MEKKLTKGCRSIITKAVVIWGCKRLNLVLIELQLKYSKQTDTTNLHAACIWSLSYRLIIAVHSCSIPNRCITVTKGDMDFKFSPKIRSWFFAKNWIQIYGRKMESTVTKFRELLNCSGLESSGFDFTIRVFHTVKPLDCILDEIIRIQLLANKFVSNSLSRNEGM